MPRLPTVNEMGARPIPSSGGAVPVARTGQVESALSNLGDTLGQIDRHLTEVRRSGELADALGKATEELGTKSIEYQRDQDFKTSPTRFKSDALAIGTKYGQGITDTRTREVFTREYGKLATAKQLGVVQGAANQERDYRVSALDSSLDSIANGMAQASTEIERQVLRDTARTSIGELRSAGWISDVQERQFVDKFNRGYFAARRNVDPVSALRELRDMTPSMDPIVASQLQGQLFQAAAPVLAGGLIQKVGFNTEKPLIEQDPTNAEETLASLKQAIRGRETGGVKNPELFESVQGARGAMQITAATFKDYAQPGESFDVEDDRVRAAERKIDADFKFYKGDVRKAAAAYLGGRGAVMPDGKIRGDVKDALGTTPAAYAEQVALMLGATRQNKINEAILNPQGLLEEYRKDPTKPTGDEVVDSLPLDQKMKVIEMAHTQANQDMAQVRQAVAGRQTDAVAALERGMQAPDAPQPQELILAYGPVVGTQKVYEQVQAKQFGEDVKLMGGMPASAQMKLLLDRQPKEGAPGAQIAIQRHDQLAKAFADVQRQRAQDPVGVTLVGAPPVKAAFDNMQQVMGGNTSEADKALATQQFAAATLAEQARLEIPTQKIMTKGLIEQIATEFSKPQQPNAANVMDGLANRWGKYYPQVIKELNDAKAIPPGAVTIGLGVKPEAAQILSEALTKKPEQLQQGIPDTDLKTLTETITKKLDPFKQTIAYQQGSIDTYDNYADSMKTLSLALMQRGMSMKDAVGKSMESMLDFKYTFDGGVRIPKSVLGGNVTPMNIKQGADALLRDLVDTSSKAFAVPSVNVPGLRPEDAAAQWKRTVLNNAVWVTAPGDGGLTLYVKSGLGAQAVLGANGQPITYKWTDLANTGTQYTAAYIGDPKFRDRFIPKSRR